MHYFKLQRLRDIPAVSAFCSSTERNSSEAAAIAVDAGIFEAAIVMSALSGSQRCEWIVQQASNLIESITYEYAVTSYIFW